MFIDTLLSDLGRTSLGWTLTASAGIFPIGFTARYAGARLSPRPTSSRWGSYRAPASARPSAARAELPDIRP